jgi:hypothetical protein
MVNRAERFVNYEFHLTYASAGHTRLRTRTPAAYIAAQNKSHIGRICYCFVSLLGIYWMQQTRRRNMLYSEAAYFDGNHCAHCAARDEHNRIERKRTEARKALDRRTVRR